MVVCRWEFRVKPGRLGDFAKLLKATFGGSERTVRVYRFKIGQRDTAAMEIEYESLAAFEKALADFATRPEAAEFSEKAHELVEGGGTSAFWELEE
jgi:hypothetical protein